MLFPATATAMKAMEAKAMKTGVFTQSQDTASVAKTNGLKNKQVNAVIDALLSVACGEIKETENCTRECTPDELNTKLEAAGGF